MSVAVGFVVVMHRVSDPCRRDWLFLRDKFVAGQGIENNQHAIHDVVKRRIEVVGCNPDARLFTGPTPVAAGVRSASLSNSGQICNALTRVLVARATPRRVRRRARI